MWFKSFYTQMDWNHQTIVFNVINQFPHSQFIYHCQKRYRTRQKPKTIYKAEIQLHITLVRSLSYNCQGDFNCFIKTLK